MTLYIDNPQTTKIYTLMGKIVSMMGVLESTTLYCFSRVSKIDMGLTQSILTGENFETILKMFDSMFSYLVKDPDLLKEFNELLIELRNINSRRNTYIHSTWYYNNEQIIKLVKLAKGGKGKPVKANLIDMDALTLDKLLQDINSTDRKISKFIYINFPEVQNDSAKKTKSETKS